MFILQGRARFGVVNRPNTDMTEKSLVSKSLALNSSPHLSPMFQFSTKIAPISTSTPVYTAHVAAAADKTNRIDRTIIDASVRRFYQLQVLGALDGALEKMHNKVEVLSVEVVLVILDYHLEETNVLPDDWRTLLQEHASLLAETKPPLSATSQRQGYISPVPCRKADENKGGLRVGVVPSREMELEREREKERERERENTVRRGISWYDGNNIGGCVLEPSPRNVTQAGAVSPLAIHGCKSVLISGRSHSFHSFAIGTNAKFQENYTIRVAHEMGVCFTHTGTYAVHVLWREQRDSEGFSDWWCMADDFLVQVRAT